MPYLVPDIAQDSVLFYLKTEVIPVKSDSFQFEFGQYEYLPTDDSGLFFQIDSISSESIQLINQGLFGVNLPYYNIFNSVVFLFFLFCFIMGTVFFRKEGTALSGNYKRIFSLFKYSSTGYKDQVTTSEVWSEIFLIFQAILILTIILFTFLYDTGIVSTMAVGYGTVFSELFAVISVFAGLKFIMYRSIASFFLDKDIVDWVSRYFRLLELKGIILFFPALVYFYLPEFRGALLILILVIFLIGRFIILIELLIIFVKNKVGGLYFFVYLCGTEIAPYFLYYKGLHSLITFAGNNII